MNRLVRALAAAALISPSLVGAQTLTQRPIKVLRDVKISDQPWLDCFHKRLKQIAEIGDDNVREKVTHVCGTLDGSVTEPVPPLDFHIKRSPTPPRRPKPVPPADMPDFYVTPSQAGCLDEHTEGTVTATARFRRCGVSLPEARG